MEELYLNGETLVSGNYTPCSPLDKDFILEPLNIGRNTLSVKVRNIGGPSWLKIMETRRDLSLIIIFLSILFLLYLSVTKKLGSNTYSLLFFTLLSVGFFYPSYKNPWNLGIADWDIATTYYTLFHKIIVEYHQFPLWEPYLCGGDSALGNSMAPFLSPLFVVALIFGPLIGLKINIVLHSIVGMFGIYLLSKHLKIMEISAHIPPVIYMLGGVYTMHLTEGHLVWMPMAFIPWVFLFYLKGKENFFFVVFSGLCCAFILLSGSPHILAYTLILIVVYTFFDIHVKRENYNTNRVIIIFIIFILSLFLFSAIKLIPIIEHRDIAPLTQKSYDVMNINILYNAFLNREQSRGLGGAMGIWYWWEYSAYIGWIPFILAILGFFSKERLPLLLTLFVLTALSMNELLGINLWDILQKLPFFEAMRIPSRILVVVVFLLSLFSGFGASIIERHARLFSFLLLSLVVLDLTLVNNPLLNGIFITPYLYENYNKTNFITVSPTSPAFLTYSAMMPEILQNKGIIYCYSPGHIISRVHAVGSPYYLGEAYIVNNTGAASVVDFTPSRIKVKVDVNSTELLVLNQNFYPGWHASTGVVESFNGLVSTKVNPEIKDVEFYYLPYSFITGFFITAMAVLLTIALSIIFIYNSHKTKIPPNQYLS
ncbi:MAG: hypothetical protein PHG85_03755 [Candidatus Altiarchaeota archaeon]|nr:hypothetical protein [Candidatus Altiarchaeota archaeon]